MCGSVPECKIPRKYVFSILGISLGAKFLSLIATLCGKLFEDLPKCFPKKEAVASRICMYWPHAVPKMAPAGKATPWFLMESYVAFTVLRRRLAHVQ